MQKIRLSVDVNVWIEYTDPPKDMNESIMRKQADVVVKKAGRQLEPIVEILIAELLAKHQSNAD